MNFEIKLSFEEPLLQRIFQVAGLRNQTAEQIILSALPFGLDMLAEEKSQASANTPTRFAWPPTLDDRAKNFVRTHCATMNNSQLAKDLRLSFSDARTARFAHAEEFVRANWNKLSNGAIKKVLGRFPFSIRIFREMLGLNHHTSVLVGLDQKTEIDVNELKLAITVEGQTTVEFFRSKGVKTTRARIHQIAKKCGVSCFPSGRTAKWYANRWKVPELGDKTGFKEALAVAGSYQALAGKYCKQNLANRKVRFLARKHDLPRFRWRRVKKGNE